MTIFWIHDQTRFAHELLLIATNRADVAKIIDALNTEPTKYGLKLHLGKMRDLTNSKHVVLEQISCHRSYVT